MHDIEPFYRWESIYTANQDKRSPFFRKRYDFSSYRNDIYGYYIHPAWDEIGSETLYIKLLFCDYNQKFAIIELIGEWNDALHNDIMHFKRNVIDYMTKEGIKYFVIIGENVLNFHGSDDCYYEEWFEDVEEGWITAIGFRDFILEEWAKYQIDFYINFGGVLETVNWRTLHPVMLFQKIHEQISKRISLI